MPNYIYGVAAVMRALSDYYLVLSKPPPDPVIWQLRLAYQLGVNLGLFFGFPAAGAPANLKVSVELRGGPEEPRWASWLLPPDELVQLTPVEADHLLRDLVWEVTDEGRIHPVVGLRRRVTLGVDDFPRLPTCALPVGTRVRVKHRCSTNTMLPSHGRVGTVLAELDGKQMVPTYAWFKHPPAHIFLVEVEAQTKEPFRARMPGGVSRLQIAFAEGELELI